MPANIYDAVDLFSGPGGWDVAARDLGLHVLGIEFDAAACRTRRAADLPTIEGDVRAFGPSDFPARGFIASPPCQTFSMAGKGSGRAALDVVLASVKALAAREQLPADAFADDRTALVLEPLRWALEAIDAAVPYEWLAFEQVPTVLPVWEAMADVLRDEGYSVAVGRVSAEQFGVPQTRKRAILVARRHGEATLPVPTHRPYKKGVLQTEGDPALLPWVSMADALGWGMSARPGLTVAVGTESGGADAACVGGSGARASLNREREEGRWTLRPSFDGGYDMTKPRPSTEPAGTVTGKLRSGAWAYERPATTVVGSFCPDIIAAPGYRTTVSRQNAEGSVRVTPTEAALLQSFPADYPWQGAKTKVFQQIGNAIPPLLARAVLAAAIATEDISA